MASNPNAPLSTINAQLRYPEDVQLISQALGALHAKLDDVAMRMNEQIKAQVAPPPPSPSPSPAPVAPAQPPEAQ